jgi:hypothetical protein
MMMRIFNAKIIEYKADKIRKKKIKLETSNHR